MIVSWVLWRCFALLCVKNKLESETEYESRNNGEPENNSVKMLWIMHFCNSQSCFSKQFWNASQLHMFNILSLWKWNLHLSESMFSVLECCCYEPWLLAWKPLLEHMGLFGLDGWSRLTYPLQRESFQENSTITACEFENRASVVVMVHQLEFVSGWTFPRQNEKDAITNTIKANNFQFVILKHYTKVEVYYFSINFSLRQVC